jgi:hypothetical protein
LAARPPCGGLIFRWGSSLSSPQTEPRWTRWLEWAILVAFVALAAFLRYWRLEEVPPGFNSDEAVGAMGGLTTLREGLRYSYEGQGGGGALGFYFVAASFYLFGPSIAAARGIAAWAGVVSVFANYWAVRELFRLEGFTRARILAGLSTLGLALSLWHIQASRVVFAGIGVPFLMLPSVYFLWLGLNQPPLPSQGRGLLWPFVVSGIFLGALMYIYLSGIFAPPFYAAFFIAQWLVIKFWQKIPQISLLNINLKIKIENLKFLLPSEAYLTTRFWQLFATGLTALLLLLPIVYVLLIRPELEPGTTRAGQAIFLNPQINRGDPWGLLGRSIIGNLSAYGVSPSWLTGQSPTTLSIPASVALCVFLGFLVALWRGLRGRAVYLFVLLWFVMMLLPSILSPDVIPHNLRTIGATTPVYVFAAVSVVWLFETLWGLAQRWLKPSLGQRYFNWLARGLALALALALAWSFWRVSTQSFYQYFYLFPKTNDAQAAYHVYAVKMAEEINREPSAEVAFILPRNTAAGDIARNFTTDFLTELAQPPAAHYWVVDNEATLPADLTAAGAGHNVLRVVKWKTSKHTGADPKQVIPYYLEKFGHYDHTDTFEFFDIDTYVLDTLAPDFSIAEKLEPQALDFGGQLRLTGYALGDAGDAAHVTDPQARSNDLLWLRLAWQKTANQPENLKVSVQIYTEAGQLVTQIDKLLQSNILQVGSARWPLDAHEDAYFLIPIPPATPPGSYTVRLAVYGEESLTRLPVAKASAVEGGTVALADFSVMPALQPADPADLKLALPIKQELLPGLTLVGFETLPGKTVRSGDQVGASLIWKSGNAPPADNLDMSLAVKPVTGDGEWPLSAPVGLAGDYQTSRWQPREVLRGWLTARIPPTLEPGSYQLSLRLTPAGKPDAEVEALSLGDFQIEGWPRNFDPPQPQVEIGANFNGQATLVGLDINNPKSTPRGVVENLKPGDTLTAQLYWRAEAEFEQNCTAFVHLIGPDGLLYGQVDQSPGAGAFPTTGWLPGEYIADAYTVPITANAPLGDYHIEIGMYNPNTGERLPVSGPDCPSTPCDDKVLVPGLTVR